MPTQGEISGLIEKTQTYLTQSLLPFWIERCADRQCGGALTYFDRHGRPTGETVKPFLMQTRILYTLSSAHRAGYGDGRCAELAEMVTRFILDHYWDDRHDGWLWIADRQGAPLVTEKVGYALLRDETYWRAFRNVYDFVFGRFVAAEAGGEWYERVDRRGNPIDSALGHAWKNSYHTVRATIQTIRRLRALLG